MNATPGADLLLAERFDALSRFLRAVTPHLPRSAVDPGVVAHAQSLVARARARLGLGASGYTVAALAGATGSGKSSLFNALARLDLSPAGALRPTTDEAHACVWGGARAGSTSDDGATALLDWLGVSPVRRFRRESVLDAEEEAALRGLVLLDLPDLDSVAYAHRVEADRLVGVVDLVIWVLDPQKYADAAVHDGYLRHMGSVRDVTVVVLNQIDRLTPDDAERCLDDLGKLVVADGLPGVAVLPTSAVTGAGVDGVRRRLESTVAGWSAALARLEGELDEALDSLRPLVGGASRLGGESAVGALSTTDDGVPRAAIAQLAEEFASAAGVGAVAAEAGLEYRARTAVPFGLRGRSRRADPLGSGPRRVGAGAEAPPADPAAVAQAVRRLAATSSAGLVAPWPEEVRDDALSRTDELTDQLTQTVRAARPRPGGRTGWWLARLLWWLAVVAALAGAAGLVWSAVGDAPDWPRWVIGGVRLGLPALLLAGGVVLAGVVMLVSRWVARFRARRWQSTVEQRLVGAATSVAREAVAPVRATLRAYDEARSAFADASGPRNAGAAVSGSGPGPA